MTKIFRKRWRRSWVYQVLRSNPGGSKRSYSLVYFSKKKIFARSFRFSAVVFWSSGTSLISSVRRTAIVHRFERRGDEATERFVRRSRPQLSRVGGFRNNLSHYKYDTSRRARQLPYPSEFGHTSWTRYRHTCIVLVLLYNALLLSMRTRRIQTIACYDWLFTRWTRMTRHTADCRIASALARARVYPKRTA